MLSSISSFLPSALQIANDKAPAPQADAKQLTESPTSKDEDDMAVGELLLQLTGQAVQAGQRLARARE